MDKPGNLNLKDWAPLAAPVVIPDAAKAKPGKPPLHIAMGYPLAPDLPNSRLPDAVIDGKPYPVKGLFVQSTNPVMSDPNRDRVQEMFRHLELGVAIELFMSETALECDIVLPETSFYEQAEIRQRDVAGPGGGALPARGGPRGRGQALVRDREGARAKMGWAQYFPYEKWEDWAELVMTAPHVPRGVQAQGLLGGTGEIQPGAEGLATPSGKVEIIPRLMPTQDSIPIRSIVERTSSPTATIPLQLTHSKLSMHCNVVTQNNPLLMEVCGENWVEINRVDAAKYGFATAPTSSSSRRRISISIKAKVVEGLVPGCITSATATASAIGPWARSRRARAPIRTI